MRKRRFALLAIVAGMPVFFAMAVSRLRPSVTCEGDLWTETVKKGDMPWDFRGTGKLVRARNPAKLIARVTVSDSTVGVLRLNQKADVDTRRVTINEHVSHINPSPSNGMRSVDIALNTRLPKGVSEDLQVEATIHVGALQNILFVGRPSTLLRTARFQFLNSSMEANRRCASL